MRNAHKSISNYSEVKQLPREITNKRLVASVVSVQCVYDKTRTKLKRNRAKVGCKVCVQRGEEVKRSRRFKGS